MENFTNSRTTNFETTTSTMNESFTTSVSSTFSSVENFTSSVKAPLHEDYRDLKRKCDFALGILTLCLFPVIACGNSLILYILYRFPRLRTSTNIYIGSLALSDAILGIFSMPVYMLYYFFDSLVQYQYLCLFKFSTVMLSFSGSLVSFLAIACDRYMAILHPLKYHTNMNKGIAIRVVIGIWIFCTATGILPFFWHYKDKLETHCQFFIVMPLAYSIAFVFSIIGIGLLMGGFLYARIFQVAFRVKRAMLERKNRFNQQSGKEMDKEKRCATTMGLVLLIFFLFWSPHMFGAGLNYYEMPLNLRTIIKNFTLIVAMSNSCVNPIIYAFRKTDISLKFKVVLDGVFCRSDNRDHAKENNSIQKNRKGKRSSYPSSQIKRESQPLGNPTGSCKAEENQRPITQNEFNKNGKCTNENMKSIYTIECSNINIETTRL